MQRERSERMAYWRVLTHEAREFDEGPEISKSAANHECFAWA